MQSDGCHAPECKRLDRATLRLGHGLPNSSARIGDDHGRPIKRAALSHLVRLAIRAAGLPARCVPHGLRKATLRTMAEAGSSSKRLAAVSGHKTTKELDRYTAAADQQTLADDGIGSIPIRK